MDELHGSRIQQARRKKGRRARRQRTNAIATPREPLRKGGQVAAFLFNLRGCLSWLLVSVTTVMGEQMSVQSGRTSVRRSSHVRLASTLHWSTYRYSLSSSCNLCF